MLGDYTISPGQVLSALVGRTGGITGSIVTEWRLPRVVAAVVFGAALALSGSLFQTITRNPLGSPDIIGFSAGSYTGALVVMILLGGGATATAFGAVVGGLVTAALVYALAYKQGLQGFRLIVVGIAAAAMLTSVNTYLRLHANPQLAMSATAWGFGSLDLVSWSTALPALCILGVLFVLVGFLRAPLRQMQLGDDLARASGVSVELVRIVTLVLGVGLIAVTTAVGGPIAFIALAAPQIARRMLRTSDLPFVTVALVGAIALLVADVISQHIVPGGSLPVGTVTVCVGGVYLIALLVHESRRRG